MLTRAHALSFSLSLSLSSCVSTQDWPYYTLNPKNLAREQAINVFKSLVMTDRGIEYATLFSRSLRVRLRLK
jgi:hypothetical protein